MKPRRRLFATRLSLPFLTAIVALLSASRSHSATLYWDLNQTTANTAVAVTGAWNGTNAFWNTEATGTGGAGLSANSNVDDLVFSSGSIYTTGTVTASGTRVARSITFEDNIAITLAGAITVGGTGGTPGIFASVGKTTATTVSGALTLASAANYQNNDTGLLTLSGTQNLAAFLLTKSGTGPVTAGGVVSGTTAAGSNAISVTNGVLTLSGANTFRGNIAVAGSSAVFAMPGTTYTATAPYGASGTANIYKQLLLTNGGKFRLTSGTFNNNGTGTNQAGGIIFNIGTGGGTLDVASGATLIIDDGTGTGTAGTASQLQGTGNLTKTGLGTFQFDDSTAYAGTITVTAGDLRPATANAFGASAAGTIIQSGAALSGGNVTMTNAEPLTINGTGLASAPAGALTANASTFTWIGPVTLGSNATIGGGAGALSLSSAATVNLGANTLTAAHAAGRTTFTGVISGTGAVIVNGSGAGDVVLSGAHTYTGGTTVNAGSTIAIGIDSTGIAGNPTDGPFGSGTTPLVLAGGQLRSGVNASYTIGNAVTLSNDTTFFTIGGEKSLVFSGPVTMSGGARTLTSNVGTTVAGTSAIFSGAIGDGGNALGLIKAGTGNLTLGGANTYTGGTTVNAGALVLTGSLPSSTALAVSPTVAGGAAFTLGSGAANPLPAVSALTLDSTTGPVTLGFDLGANTAASDSITTPAAATTSGSVNLSIQALAGFGSASSYDLISAASGLGGASYVLTNAPGGYTYSLTTSGTLVSLNVTADSAGDLHWRGDTGNSWSAFSGSNTNWYSNSAGTTNAQANPGGGDTVNFSAVNAITAGGVITTTLDNNFTVNDLVFGDTPNGVTSVTIGGGTGPGGVPGVLSIAPTSSADGIGVGSNAGNVTVSAPVLLGAAQTWSVDGTGANGSTLTVSGALSGSAALTVNGLVTLSAGGTSTHSGATTVPNGSVLQGGAANSFSASTAVAVDATGIVRLNGFNNRAASLTGAGTLQNNHASTGATLTVGDATNFSFVGTLQNGAAAALGLTKIGTGSLTLSGANTHTGATTVNEGTLIFGTATTLTGTNPVTLAGTGTLDINGFSVSTGAITSAVATSTITNSSPSTAPSTATALNTPSGAGIYVDALNSASGGNIAALITDGPTRKTQVVINNANGNAQLTNDSNTFSGGLVLLDNPAGTRLNISAAIAGARFGTGPLVIGQAPTDRAGVFFNGVDNTLGLPIFMNTGLGTDRFGIRNDGRAITLSGLITANSDVTFSSNSATASNTIITNQITGAGGLAVDLSQTSTANTLHTVTLGAAANANNYAGDTQIGRTNVAPGQNYTAALALGAADQIPDGAGKGNVIITNNSGTRTGTLRLAGFSDTINGLSGNGNVDGVSGTPTLTLGGNDAPGSFSGNILNGSGTLTVTKIGSGTQVFSGASTFAGPLNVSGGLVAFATSPATAGPLGNSTVVNLSGGGISFTAAGANSLNRPVAVLGSTGTVDVANASGALTLAATSTGGDLVKTGPGIALITGSTELNLVANGAGVVVNGGVLQAGFGTTDVATVTVGATGSLSLADSVAETLTLDTSSGALTLNGGAQLGFDLIGAGNDSIAVAVGGTAATSGTVTLNFFGTPTATTYTLLAADSGLNGATYALGAAPSGFNYTINASPTAVTLTVTAELPVYWRDGQANGLWSTLGSPANWTSDAAGTVDAASTPLSGNAVIFSATGATAASTLDAAFTVDSLRFANSHTITASGPGALTLTPASTSGGLRVLSGGLTATISAPLTAGVAQTWDVDATGSLIVTGNTVFNANVTKTNTGALTLSGTNSGTGAITLAGGTLNLNSATALGGGLFTIGAGTTLNTPTGAIALTTNNAQTWNGDFTFTGANNLDLGTGAVTLGNSVAINTAGSTLTVGGAIGDGGNNRGLTKAGTGTIVLNSANSYGGLTTINAGVLRITNGAALGTTGAGTTQSGTSALELDGTGGDITLGAEALTINGGGITDLGALRNIAGNNTYGGTVTMGIQSRINSDSGTLTLNNPTAVSATNLTLVVGGAGNLTISGAIATGTGGVAKDGAGVLTLSGTNTYTGSTTVNGGILNITGSISGLAATTNLAYGGTAGNTIVNISGSGSIANYKNFTGANVAGSIAVMNQTGGSTSTLGTNGQDTQWVAQNGGYGYLNITGGTFNTGRFDAVGATGTGTAVVYVGGTGTFNNNSGDFLILPRKLGVGQLTVGPGGSLVRTAGVTQTFGITMDGSNAHGALNIAGGNVDTGVRALLFGFGTAAFTNTRGFVNLAGGTLSVGAAISQTNTNASSQYFEHFNFAGGTLRSNAAITWLPVASAVGHTISATIYGPVTNNNNANSAFNTQIGASSNFTGGLTVDTNGFATTIAQALRVAGGVGVTQADIGDVSLLSGNSGYIGAPSVVFSAPAAPTGVPASGYAVIDSGTGKVNGIVITNPGTYAASETPTITLTGGGGSIAPFATAALATANTSGGLTKSGLGTLTLTGANTYSGATLVSAGALQLNGAAATGLLTTSGVTVEAAGTLGFTAAAASTLDLTGKNMTLNGGTLALDIGDAGVNDAITVDSFTLTANSAFSFTSIGAIGGSYTLVTSTTPITNAGPYTISGQTIGRVTLTPTVGTNTITVNSTVFEGKWALTGGGNWSLGDPNATQDNWLNYKPTVPGDAALFGDTITAPSTVAVDTPHIAGYLRFDNANAYTIGANGSSNLTLNNGTSNAVATVTSGSHTIAENVALLSHLDVIPAAGTNLTMSGVVSGATRNLEVNGPGAVVLSGVNTYGGTTTVSNGTLTLSGARTATMGAVTVGNLTATTGTLDISNGTFTTGTFSVGSGTGSTTAGIVNHTGGTLTMSGSQLLLGNGGTGLLPGSNSTGTYNLNGGTLNTVAGGVGVLIGTNTGATGVFNLSSGTLNMAATSTLQIARSDNSTALATTGTFSQTGGTATVGILQMSGIATGAANNANGSATLSLTGGTFSAATFNALSGGNGSSSTITIGGSAQVTLPAFPTNAKGTSATAAITFDSTTGFLSPAVASATYMPAGTFNNAFLTANGAKFDVPTGRDITVAQVLADAVSPAAVGTLTKSGVGGLTLSGANLYSGLTTVSAGTIGLGNVDALGTTAAGTTVASGARVTFGALATASTVAEPFDIAGDGTATNGVFNVGGSKTINLSGPITLSANARITVDGGAAFNLTNAAAVTATDKDLTFHTDGSAASSITGIVSLGTGSLTKSSTSTLVLSGNNSYSGGSSITGGVLQVNNNNALGSGTVTLNGGIRLAVNAGVDIPNAVTLGANTGTAGRGLVEAVGVSGTAIVSGPITITNGAAAGGHFNAAAGTILELRGAITSTLVDGVTGRTTFVHRAGNVMFSGGGTGYELLNIGQGTTIVGANNGIATTARVNIGTSAAGNLDLNGFNQSLDGITKGSFAAIIGNSSTTTDSVLTTTGVSNYAGIIQNALGAGTRKVGLVVDSGALTLSAANTYTGDTVVNAAGTIDLADNAQLKFTLGNTSGDNNDLTGAGTATLDGDFVIDTSAADALATGTWTLEDVTTLTGGAYGATFSVVGFTDIGGDKWEKPVGLTKKYTFDEATGILTLGPNASYSSWIAGFGLAGPDAAATADPDFDGIENAVEMVLGGNPATGMDTALLPTIELVNADPDGDLTFTDYLLYTYRRSDLSVTAGVTADCETDTDLVAPWTAATGAPGVVIQVDNNFTFSPPAAADTDRVRVYVPRGANTTLFGRLNVVVP